MRTNILKTSSTWNRGKGHRIRRRQKLGECRIFPIRGQVKNKIVYFLLVCHIICYYVNKKTLLLACYHLAIDIRSISNKNPASSLVASVGNRDQWKNNGKLIAPRVRMTDEGRLALVSIYQTDVTSFSKMEEVLNGYVTNPTPTLTANPNRNPNSNPNQINKKIQKETTLKTDQMT